MLPFEVAKPESQNANNVQNIPMLIVLRSVDVYTTHIQLLEIQLIERKIRLTVQNQYFCLFSAFSDILPFENTRRKVEKRKQFN